jgi:hypothetical protein
MCAKTSEELEESYKRPYGRLVGKVLYLVTCSRPDLAQPARELARFIANHGEQHWKAAKHLIRYLQGTKSYGVLLGRVDKPYPIFHGLSDSDWGMSDNRKSVSGYIIFFADGPISWSSKQQGTVALSSCEAEYLATTHAAKQILWLRSLASELKINQMDPTSLFCDNQGTVACTHDPQAHTKMKHIDLREHFIRDCVNNRHIEVIHIPGIENSADLLTKPLDSVIHKKWIQSLRLDSVQGGC